MQGVLGELKGLGAKLDRLTRLEMEALANRFEVPRIFALSDDALCEALHPIYP